MGAGIVEVTLNLTTPTKVTEKHWALALFQANSSTQAEWLEGAGHCFPSSEGAEQLPKMMEGMRREGMASRGHPEA